MPTGSFNPVLDPNDPIVAKLLASMNAPTEPPLPAALTVPQQIALGLASTLQPDKFQASVLPALQARREEELKRFQLTQAAVAQQTQTAEHLVRLKEAQVKQAEIEAKDKQAEADRRERLGLAQKADARAEVQAGRDIEAEKRAAADQALQEAAAAKKEAAPGHRLVAQTDLFPAKSAQADNAISTLHNMAAQAPAEYGPVLTGAAEEIDSLRSQIKSTLDDYHAHPELVTDETVADLQNAMDRLDDHIGGAIVTAHQAASAGLTDTARQKSFQLRSTVQQNRIKAEVTSNLIISEQTKRAIALMDSYGGGTGDLGGPVEGLAPVQMLEQSGYLGAGYKQKAADTAKLNHMIANVTSAYNIKRTGTALSANEAKIYAGLIAWPTSTYTTRREILDDLLSLSEGGLAGAAMNYGLDPNDIELQRQTVGQILDTPGTTAENVVRSMRGSSQTTPGMTAVPALGGAKEAPEGVLAGSTPLPFIIRKPKVKAP